jgi:hypothetical protein
MSACEKGVAHNAEAFTGYEHSHSSRPDGL